MLYLFNFISVSDCIRNLCGIVACAYHKFRKQKNGRPFSLNSKYSIKRKRLQVNEKWSSLRQLAKISLFLPFYTAEKIFYSTERTFFSETTAKCPEKRCKLAHQFYWHRLSPGNSPVFRRSVYFFYCLPHQIIKLFQFHHFRQCGIRIIQLYKTVKFFRSGKILH